METEEPAHSVEAPAGAPPAPPPALPSPRKKAAESPGVLQLGEVRADKAVEVEAVRIVVPKAAITHAMPRSGTKAQGRRKGERLGRSDGGAEPSEGLAELKKLKNSERRLLQDKEGLSNQLRVQTEVRPAPARGLGECPDAPLLSLRPLPPGE